MVRHISFPLINSFNKTEAAVFPMQAMLQESFFSDYFNSLQVVTNRNRMDTANPTHVLVKSLRVEMFCM